MAAGCGPARWRDWRRARQCRRLDRRALTLPGLADSRLRRLLPCPSRLSRKRLSTLARGCPASRAGHQPPSSHRYRIGARKAVADVMGQARSDSAGLLQTKLANDGGYAVNKLRKVF